MQNKLVQINFSGKVIIFFIFLEGLTVPMVAWSNSFAANNIIYSAGVGFVVAAICILFLFKTLKKLIIKNSRKIFGIEITDFNGLIIIGLMAGVLLMVMFIVQFILFSHGANDYIAGFFSGTLSVFATLCIYELFSFITPLNIVIVGTDKINYQIHFKISDIVLLSLLFGIYELIVCPITGTWVPFTTWRIPVAILSGIIGGGFGGLFLFLATNWLKIRLFMNLKAN